ncbi:MAG TPA: trigger factor [Nitrospiraceae bacterium]|nr:trigger factor [Nitrospiraceae bacterium]
MLQHIEEITPTIKKLRIEVPSSIIEDEISQVYRRLQSTAMIPGFRTGKAPQSILERRFGRSVEAEVMEKLIPEFYSKAVKEAGIMPVTLPNIEGKIEFIKNQPLLFTVTVEVKPEIGQLNYEGLKLKERPLAFEEHEVYNALKMFQEDKALFEISEEGVKEGDMVIIDHEGYIEGIAVESLSVKDFTFIQGSESMPEEFSSGLIGKKKGDPFEVKISFKDDHPNKTIAGKEVIFNVLVKEVKRKVIPPLDNDLAKSFGYESIAGLKERLREDIIKNKKEQIEIRYKKELLNRLTDSIDFELPQSMVNRELEHCMLEAKRIAEMRGEAVKTDDELKLENEHIARRNVKAIILLDVIGEKEKIVVTDEEMREEIKEIADRHRLKPEDVMKFYIARDGSLEGLKGKLYEDKVMSILLSKANIEQS